MTDDILVLLREAPDPDDVLERVLRLRAIDIVSEARALVDDLPIADSHRRLLAAQLDEGRDLTVSEPDLPAIQLPLLVHADVTGSHEPARQLAVACLLVYLGADLFDSAVDGELSARWQGRRLEEVHLAAATFLASLPHLALERLAGAGVDPQVVWTLAHDLAVSLLIMSSGEHDDLRMEGRDGVTPAECRSMMERKAGAEIAVFSRAGAVLARCDEEAARAYWEFGRALGSAGSIASDAADIWLGEPSYDLLNGKRSLTIVHALHTLEGAERAELQDLLVRARESEAVHDEVRVRVAEAGSLRYMALVVGMYKQQALRALERAGPGGEARPQLEAYLERFFVPRVADRGLHHRRPDGPP